MDLSDAGIVRTHVDAARERISENTRRPASTRLGRFWQLSGGIAKCGVCGSALSPHQAHRSYGKIDGYYRCYQRYNSGPRDCTNTVAMTAPRFEESVWQAVYGLISDPERLLRQYETHLERQRHQMRGDPDREVRELTGQLQQIEGERRGYLRQNAWSVLSDSGLDELLAGLDERRKELQRALREAQARQEALRKPRINYAHLNSLLLQLNGMRLNESSLEDRRRIYEALRLRVEVGEDRSVRLSGVFDPDVYLPNVLRDPPDIWTPRPEVPEGSSVVVTSDSSHRGT